MNKEEKRAIAAFKGLAKRWPKSLRLVQHGDSNSLSVKQSVDKEHPHFDDPALGETLDHIKITIECCA